MRKREWKRCTDPYLMVRQVDWPYHLMPDVSARVKAIQLRRFRLFTLTAGAGLLTRVNHPTCNAAAEVVWRMAEGTASPDQIAAGSDVLGALWAELHTVGMSLDSFAILHLVNILSLLFREQPYDAARNLTARRTQQWDEQPLTPEEERLSCDLLRDIFGNRGDVPAEPRWQAAWRTSTAVAMARQMYESREFSAMPILADALQDAGCDRDDILDHCRGPGPHVRGCWVVDLVLGKS